jgi:hypothetical protein
MRRKRTAAGGGRAAAIGGLPFILTVGGVVLSVFLTRAFLDWNEGLFPWKRIYTGLVYFLSVPFALGMVGRFRGSLVTFLLVSGSAALAAAVVAGEHYASPVGYDNADSLAVAVFINTAIHVLSLGLLLPMALAGFWLWRQRQT